MKKLLLIFAAATLWAGSATAQVRVGAERMNEYLPMLEGKKVGVLTNHTGIVEGGHLVDALLARGVRIEAIFAPEHGFRGTAVAGEHVDDTRDEKTGIEIISVYGNSRKPRAEDVRRCDVIVFDIQDVGCRFYTYLSTMHYAMETCAETGVPMIVLDRPNPNGMYVDGPILDVSRHRSFVGMHAIPVVHGMTLGELARMINGERWLGRNADGELKCDLTVIACEGYTHDTRYELPVAPSPGLPNMRSVYLYPSICFFENTSVDVGRGSPGSFQMLTYPDGTVVDLRTGPYSNEELISRGVDLSYLISAWRIGATGRLPAWFEQLMGVDWVRPMLEGGATAEAIKARWAPDVERFRARRQPYLIYN